MDEVVSSVPSSKKELKYAAGEAVKLSGTRKSKDNVPVSSSVINGKPAEGATTLMEANDVAEQDLSEEEDDYRDTFVKRYRPGIHVNVKLKEIVRDLSGKHQQIPMVINFFEECMKTYQDERRFMYEDSYLNSSHGYSQLARVSGNNRVQVPGNNGGKSNSNGKGGGKSVASGSRGGPDRKGHPEFGVYEPSLDDVMWLKNRPNDPLLRCIQSITDRLNIQGIVGDPATYLAEGGDDMHYDIDDPFIDDAEMYSELHMSRNDILKKGMIDKDFSVWSEEEEELGYADPLPEEFIARYASECDFKEVEYDDESRPLVLFFHPGAWKRFTERIPKQIHPIFKEYEHLFKTYTGYISTADIKETVDILLETILARVVKIQEPKQRKKPSQGDDDAEANEDFKKKVEAIETYGLGCIGVGRVLGLNGRIMRWIARTIYEMTNAMSWYDLNGAWINLVLKHNQTMINNMEMAMVAKLRPKLLILKEKRSPRYFKRLDDDLKNLAKRIFHLKRVVREYEELCEGQEGIQEDENKDQEGENKEGKSTACEDHLGEDAPKGGKDLGQAAVKYLKKIENGKIDKNTDMGICQSMDMLSVQESRCENSHDGPRAVVSDAEDCDRNGTQNDMGLSQELNSESHESMPYFSTLLRMSPVWRRIRDTISLYKLAGTEVLTLVQMINLDLATTISIGETDFKELVKDSINGSNLFDKAYSRLADIVAQQVNELIGSKLVIHPYVSRVAVMWLHESSAVESLLEEENEEKLVLYENSRLSPPVGKVRVFGVKLSKKASEMSPSETDAVDEVKMKQLKASLQSYMQRVKSESKADKKNEKRNFLSQECGPNGDATGDTGDSTADDCRATVKKKAPSKENGKSQSHN